MKSISFFVAMRNIHFKIRVTDLFERIEEHRRARNAVAIEIAIDDYSFVAIHRIEDPIERLPHIGQEQRIVQVRFVTRIQKRFDRILLDNVAAREEQLYEFRSFGHSASCA